MSTTLNYVGILLDTDRMTRATKPNKRRRKRQGLISWLVVLCRRKRATIASTSSYGLIYLLINLFKTKSSVLALDIS
jgi:hypothetical protein